MKGCVQQTAMRLAMFAMAGVCATAVGVGQASAQQSINLGHLAPTDDPRHEAMELFASLVEEGTEGEITVSVYPDSTLGTERELVEQLQGGITEVALVGGIVANFYPQWTIMDMPFLWDSPEHQYEFIRSEYGQAWIEDMAEESGVTLLEFFERNPRVLATRDRPVESIEDLEGMQVRVPEIDSYLTTWRAFGVEPTPMPADEFYMGLQLGTIDAMENPIGVHYHWNIFEVADYLAMTEHMRSGFYFLVGSDWFEGLSSEHQEVIRSAASEAQQLQMELEREDGATLAELLEAEGMTITQPDTTGFREASQQVHDEYMDVFGEDVYDYVLGISEN